MNEKVTEFFNTITHWKKELHQLREIALDCGLTEELKWRQPCYTYKNSNILILGGFKNFFVLSFFKGVLLSDSEKLLVAPGKNSRSTRQFNFENLKEVIDLETTIKSYIFEAIEVENLGLKIEIKKDKKLKLVDELIEKMEENPKLKKAFHGLTPGRQRGYNLFFESAKQSKTRISRIDKYTSRILMGKGINDCVCGFSKKMPGCDGSHKYL